MTNDFQLIESHIQLGECVGGLEKERSPTTIITTTALDDIIIIIRHYWMESGFYSIPSSYIKAEAETGINIYVIV